MAGPVLLGCRTPTQITVELTTDVPCDTPTSRANTTLSVGSLGTTLEQKPPVVVTSECSKVGDKTWRIGSLVVVPSGDKGAEVGIRVVTGFGKDPARCADDPKDCIVARRALRFVPHTELYLPIGLDADCNGVPCGATTTCVAGQCVSATIVDSAKCSTPNACDESALPKPPGGGGPGVWKPIKPASDGHYAHGAVFIGGALIVWGGQLLSTPGYTATGERYDPTTDSWKALASAPLEKRTGFVMTATSPTTMIVWGGLGHLTDGAIYDATTDTWKMISPFPLAARQDVAWTYAPARRELIVWGGESASGALLGDGARYSIDADRWTAMAPAPVGPRAGATAVWNGTTVVVYGGGCSPAYCEDTVAYDPAKDTWTVIPNPSLTKRRDVVGLATGPASELATFYGGGLHTPGDAVNDGASWDGTRWIPIPSPPDPPRVFPTVWWDGRRLDTWGGASGGVQHADGAAYDPVTSSWTALPASGLSPREGATVVWTGSSAIVFGGDGDPTAGVETELADGAIFTP